jgi:RNA polymerase sigma factor (sigma-70 family)
MKISDEDARKLRLSPQQARDTLGAHIDRLEKEIKKKIALYKPLDFKTAGSGFRAWLEADEYEKVREIPPDRPIETFLDELRRDYLVERAYLALQETIDRLVKFKLNHAAENDMTFLEMSDFIKERLEEDSIKKLKQFSEKSSFKTFLYTTVGRLVIDYWRCRARSRQNVAKYGNDIEAMFNGVQESPVESLIDREEEKTKIHILGLLPQVIAKLDVKEKLAVKMRYEQDANPGEIARTLGCSRYKAERLIKATENKIKKIIENQLEWRKT